MFNGKKSPHSLGCFISHLVVSALLFLTSVAALFGVYFSHFLVSGVAFGTSSGSLAIIAFAVSVTCFWKQVKITMGGCGGTCCK
jgi:hypothetical protein